MYFPQTRSAARRFDGAEALRMAAAAFWLACLSLTAPPWNAAAAQSARSPDRSGVVKVRSAHGHEETVERLRKDVESKGIRFFMLIEQSKLAAAAGVSLRPSSLLVFGNPPLGSLFIVANPQAGLDWPVRVLVYTDEKEQVWAAYTDFAWIARRHRIKTNLDAFKTASGVIASIMASIAASPAGAH